jgi:hypothetical protein
MTYAAVNGLNLYYEVHGDGDTAEKWTRGFSPADLPVSAAYRRLSPDGVAHRPVVLGRLKPMRNAESGFTRRDAGQQGCGP